MKHLTVQSPARGKAPCLYHSHSPGDSGCGGSHLEGPQSWGPPPLSGNMAAENISPAEFHLASFKTYLLANLLTHLLTNLLELRFQIREKTHTYTHIYDHLNKWVIAFDKIQHPLMINILNKLGVRESSHCGSAETNPTSIHKDEGSLPGPAQRVKDLVLLWAVV